MSTKWCTIAPIKYWDTTTVPANFWDRNENQGKSFNLSHDVILRPAPDWAIDKQILNNLTKDQGEQLQGSSRICFVIEYEADSLGDPDSEYQGEQPRSKQDRAHELIHLANLALWIAKPSSIGFDFIIDADSPSNSWELRSLSSAKPLLPLDRDYEVKLETNDLENARGLHSSLFALPRDKAVWIAVRTIWLSLQEREWSIRYLLLWIALEALFGPEDGREITYRLSQRVAFFLTSDRKQRQALFKAVKDGYVWRSKVAHGMKLGKLTPEKSEK